MKCFSKNYLNTTIKNMISYLQSLNEYSVTDSDDAVRENFYNLSTTRHLQLWHDASCLSNHGYILFTINALYDPAVYFSDSEYEQISGKNINVQNEIEKPQLYIVGRCRSNGEQLAYVETRLECLHKLAKGTESKGIIIKDVMRIFHGDAPAAQLEAGQQKGGHYFCPTCGIHASKCNDIIHSYYIKSFTYQQRFEKVMAGKISQSHSRKRKLKAFEHLSVDFLKKELKSRNLPSEGNKAILSLQLQREMKGMIRVPALCYYDPTCSIQNLNLQNYEIATVEPMHDIAGEEVISLFYTFCQSSYILLCETYILENEYLVQVHILLVAHRMQVFIKLLQNRQI